MRYPQNKKEIKTRKKKKKKKKEGESIPGVVGVGVDDPYPLPQ